MCSVYFNNTRVFHYLWEGFAILFVVIYGLWTVSEAQSFSTYAAYTALMYEIKETNRKGNRETYFVFFTCLREIYL